MFVWLRLINSVPMQAGFAPEDQPDLLVPDDVCVAEADYHVPLQAGFALEEQPDLQVPDVLCVRG